MGFSHFLHISSKMSSHFLATATFSNDYYHKRLLKNYFWI